MTWASARSFFCQSPCRVFRDFMGRHAEFAERKGLQKLQDVDERGQKHSCLSQFHSTVLCGPGQAVEVMSEWYIEDSSVPPLSLPLSGERKFALSALNSTIYLLYSLHHVYCCFPIEKRELSHSPCIWKMKLFLLGNPSYNVQQMWDDRIQATVYFCKWPVGNGRVMQRHA